MLTGHENKRHRRKFEEKGVGLYVVHYHLAQCMRVMQDPSRHCALAASWNLLHGDAEMEWG